MILFFFPIASSQMWPTSTCSRAWNRRIVPVETGRVRNHLWYPFSHPKIEAGWWYTYPSEKYEFVSWVYYSQYIFNIWKNRSHVPNHQIGRTAIYHYYYHLTGMLHHFSISKSCWNIFDRRWGLHWWSVHLAWCSRWSSWSSSLPPWCSQCSPWCSPWCSPRCLCWMLRRFLPLPEPEADILGKRGTKTLQVLLKKWWKLAWKY